MALGVGDVVTRPCHGSLAPHGLRLLQEDGTLYDVRTGVEPWECDCPDYVFRRANLDAKGCKHVAALRVLTAGEGEEEKTSARRSAEQETIYQTLIAHVERAGYQPSVDELAQACSMGRADVARAMAGLIRLGYLGSGVGRPSSASPTPRPPPTWTGPSPGSWTRPSAGWGR